MITLVQVRSHGMAEVANGGHVTVWRWTVLTPCISVEATAKGFIAYTAVVPKKAEMIRRAVPDLYAYA